MVPAPLIFRRAIFRNGPPKSGKTPRNVAEYSIMIVRTIPGKKGQSNLPDLGKYLDQIRRLFANTHQQNGNIVIGYEPQRECERLKDINGKLLRPMAEKSGPLNRYVLARCCQHYIAPTSSHGVPLPCSYRVFSLRAVCFSGGSRRGGAGSILWHGVDGNGMLRCRCRVSWVGQG